MKAITVEPKKQGSVCLEDVPEPDVRDGSVLVEAVAVGVCGTDVEIAEGKYGWAPPGKMRLVLGHESLGRVLDPDPASGLKKGDLVVGIVRRPDDLGATYHSCSVAEIGFEPDVIMECTGVGQIISESISVIGASGVVCLTGVGHGGALPQIPTANVASSAVLKNNVLLGSVNANKRHWYKAGKALARAEIVAYASHHQD